MKRVMLLVVTFIILVILVSGCGIPQEDYDAVVSERDTALAEISSLQSELDATETALNLTKEELNNKEKELASSQSEVESLESELSDVNSKLSSANSRLLTANSELSTIKEVYPPRDFDSISELNDWLVNNDVSERELATYAETWYMRALEIQEDALKDGYIVSAFINYDIPSDTFVIMCGTIINGDIWVWDPDYDEPLNYSEAAQFQSVR